MDESHQKLAVEALCDWSKWLIGFNLAASGGCIAVLLGGVQGLPLVFLIAAIISFAISVLSSILMVKMLVNVMEALPVRDDTGQVTSIYNFRLYGRISLGSMAWFQFAFTVIAVVFFLIWVLLRPPT